MEVRYMGFDQFQNARSYRFDVVEKGQPAKHFIVTADISLFHTHGVGIQEGPALSAGKLAADLENAVPGQHELTTEDLLSYANARAAESARRIERRKAPKRPPSPGEVEPSPWGSYGARNR